ncbi:MAG: M48 family metalloprotease [Syntrophales bacterium]|nr:M48 family metalloprotease [Syntrophales bacterium]
MSEAPNRIYLSYGQLKAPDDEELEADKKAVEVMENCLHIPHERIIKLFESYRNCSGGGFWSTHPSWDDRIENISKPEWKDLRL